MPSSRLRLLQQIRDAIDVNISLHGGCVTPMTPVIRAVQDVVEDRIDLLGAAGRSEV